jgi:hypothetical protein
MAANKTLQNNPDNLPVTMEEDNPHRPTLPSKPLNTTADSDDWHVVTNKRRQHPDTIKLSHGSSTIDALSLALHAAIRSTSPEKREFLQQELMDIHVVEGLLPRHASGNMPRSHGPSPTASALAPLGIGNGSYT